MSRNVWSRVCGLGLLGLLSIAGPAEAAALYDLSARIGVARPLCPLTNLGYCLGYEYIVNGNETTDSASSNVSPAGSPGSAATAQTSGFASERPHFVDSVPTLPDRGDHTFGASTFVASVAATGTADGVPGGVAVDSRATYAWGFEILNAQTTPRELELLLEWDWEALLGVDDAALDGVSANLLLEANGATLAQVPLTGGGAAAGSGFAFVTITVPAAVDDGTSVAWGRFVFDMSARVEGQATSVSVPEPGTLGLLLAGALPVALGSWRRRSLQPGR